MKSTFELYSHAACFSPLVFLNTSPAYILLPKILGVPFGNIKIDLLSHFTPFGGLWSSVKRRKASDTSVLITMPV